MVSGIVRNVGSPRKHNLNFSNISTQNILDRRDHTSCSVENVANYLLQRKGYIYTKLNIIVSVVLDVISVFMLCKKKFKFPRISVHNFVIKTFDQMILFESPLNNFGI